MTREKLIEYLKNQDGKKVILDLKGIITTKLEIKKMQIKYEEGYVSLQNKENELSKVELNLHQLIRIRKIEDNKVLLEFDQLQNVIIEIK